jgi:hypothetical protein
MQKLIIPRKCKMVVISSVSEKEGSVESPPLHKHVARKLYNQLALDPSIKEHGAHFIY